MRKRGQFYLVAAFVIVIIIFGLTYVYINVKAPINGISVSDIGEEMNYEAKQIINNKINGGNGVEIEGEISKLFNYYDARYPNIEIVIIYGDEGGVKTIDSSGINDVGIVDGKVGVSLGEDMRELEIKSGQKNLYVMLKSEREGEKNIVVK